MPTDISVYRIGNSINGNAPAAPEWPRLDGEKALPEASDSKTFELAGPCIIAVTATVKVRIDVRLAADAAFLAPANSPEVLEAGVLRYFVLQKGNWMLKTALFV